MSQSPSTWGPGPAVAPSPRSRRLAIGCLPVILVLVGSVLLTMVGNAVIDEVVPGGRHGTAWGALQLLGAVAAGVVSFRRYRRGSPVPWWSYVLVLLILPLAAIGMLSGYLVYRGRSWAKPQSRPFLQSPFGSWSHLPDPVQSVRDQAWSIARGGAFLGVGGQGNWLGVKPEDALLVIGPPRQGKTTGVIIPSVLVAPGPCVSSSVKDDVFCTTYKARARFGRIWRCDPTGEEAVPADVTRLRWSPVSAASTWDRAQLIAESMSNAIKQGDSENAHFIDKAKELLAPLLYAAYLGNRSIVDVSRWVHRLHEHEVVNEVGLLVEDAASAGDEGAEIAYDVLLAIITTEDREKSGIISTANRILRAYTTLGGRRMGENPNFDPDDFVRSTDTIYITSPADRQALYAPMIVGLLEQIRYAAYRRHAGQMRGEEPKAPHVSLILDEIANTAPIPVPAIVSEAGGQGVQVIAATQDFSQMSARWGQSADGLWTLFKVKLILSGVGHAPTLEAISQQLGEYDRLSVSETVGATSAGPWPWSWSASGSQRTRSTTQSYVRQRQLSPGEIANLPDGRALAVFGAQWQLIRLVNCFRDMPWTAVISSAQTAAGPAFSDASARPQGVLKGAYGIRSRVGALLSRSVSQMASSPARIVAVLAAVVAIGALALIVPLRGGTTRGQTVAPNTSQQSGAAMTAPRLAPTAGQARAAAADYLRRLNERAYDSTWSSLTDHFKQTVNQNNVADYRAFWESVSATSLWGRMSTYHGVDGRTEWVSLPLQLNYLSGKTTYVWSWWGFVSNGGSLFIDSQAKGTGCDSASLSSCKPDSLAEAGAPE